MGYLLLLPFLFVRFVVLALLDKGAVGRAAHFAPMEGREKFAYWLYQISRAAIIITLVFLKIKTEPRPLFFTGLAVCVMGFALLVVSVVGFAAPSEIGLNKKGIYRFSRNPMYLAYFLYFLGCSLLSQSPVLLGLTVLFQITGHWVILAEERWCLSAFGKEYERYKNSVRRYI